MGRVLRLIPRILHLKYQRISVVGRRALVPLEAEVVVQLVGIPVLIRSDDIAVPVVPDELFQILAVRRFGIGDLVVGKPALQLCFVPFVIC